MSRTLHVLCCRNYRPELEAAAAAEGWPDVRVAAFDARCGRPPIGWADLRPLLPEEDGDALVIGGACLCALEIPPERRTAVRIQRCGQCFELVAGAMQIAEALARNAYLVTPGWLDAWRAHLEDLGFTGTSAAALFREFARELVLLDTGVSPRAADLLTELGRTLALPSSRVPVGLDVARHRLARLVAEWRLDVERAEAADRDASRAGERADLVATLDLVGRLVTLGSETEVAEAIEELFRMLFAPRRIDVVRVEAETIDGAVPATLRSQIAGLQGDWAWTAPGTGFLVRVAHLGETVAVIVLDGLAFPQYRSRYLDLALSVARVSGLAIRNARTHRRLGLAVRDRVELERRLELEARSDGLTGCPNRRAFLREAEHEFARARRYGGELSLIMLDLDGFDVAEHDRASGGRPSAEEVLREVARVCVGALRSHDVVARLGGEELAVLLPETGAAEAAEVAERLRQALKQAAVRLSDGPPVGITTSLGVAGLDAGDAGVDAVIRRADRALCDARSAGRDRVVTWVEPARPGAPRPP